MPQLKFINYDLLKRWCNEANDLMSWHFYQKGISLYEAIVIHQWTIFLLVKNIPSWNVVYWIMWNSQKGWKLCSQNSSRLKFLNFLNFKIDSEPTNFQELVEEAVLLSSKKYSIAFIFVILRDSRKFWTKFHKRKTSMHQLSRSKQK